MAVGNMHNNLVKMRRVVPKICSRTDKQTHTDRQTDRQTATLITIHRSPIGGGVMNYAFTPKQPHSLATLSLAFTFRIPPEGRKLS